MDAPEGSGRLVCLPDVLVILYVNKFSSALGEGVHKIEIFTSVGAVEGSLH